MYFDVIVKFYLHFKIERVVCLGKVATNKLERRWHIDFRWLHLLNIDFTLTKVIFMIILHFHWSCRELF